MQQWSSEYSVGNELLDAHHHVFFEMVTELRDDLEKEHKDIDAHTIIAFLSDYIDMHFHVEEQYMTAIGFPELSKHTVVHHQFAEHVNGLLHHSTQSASEVLNFMQQWLIQHILCEDKLYYLHAQRQLHK
ncbi:bacteriohemerythrin [Rhodoferax sp. 4810]|uniref:Bacteriohemerythrin n=1 Tax=Thiospirillum jenense TaxID=1653858 RepID=A0A839HIV0_9GAMM|nr:bacteriohemerythrin [Thiospirillum jenense]MBB1075118.1 bacteriohemerythrin [Rhodoferax jenense]MBB1126767.1 bacteriohemerythrin [Thiospirillum jenense]